MKTEFRIAAPGLGFQNRVRDSESWFGISRLGLEDRLPRPRSQKKWSNPSICLAFAQTKGDPIEPHSQLIVASALPDIRLHEWMPQPGKDPAHTCRNTACWQFLNKPLQHGRFALSSDLAQPLNQLFARRSAQKDAGNIPFNERNGAGGWQVRSWITTTSAWPWVSHPVSFAPPPPLSHKTAFRHPRAGLFRNG
jgi:hypothetical protein